MLGQDSPGPDVLFREGVLDSSGNETDGTSGHSTIDSRLDSISLMEVVLLRLDLDGMWVRHL